MQASAPEQTRKNEKEAGPERGLESELAAEEQP